MNPFPKSIAVAGAWGYIGRKFLEASLAEGITAYVYDPGEPPADLDLSAATRIRDAEEFYQLPAELFHLALHPEHRRQGTETLLERGRTEPILILNEKPMALPEQPGECQRLIDATRDSGAVMLYDFPELYDSMTRRVVGWLQCFDETRITKMTVTRSKDREGRENPRNRKRMVPIQFQESVHCTAFVLYLLGKIRGSVEAAVNEGITVDAKSEAYDPPNPEAYPHVVDGRCRYELMIGETQVTGVTDFKANAPWSKRRVVEGVADGKPFTIDVDYLEGKKRLIINGEDQGCDPAADSYSQAISTSVRWFREIDKAELTHGVHPNPEFARLTYQLSGALWRSSQERGSVRLASMAELLGFDSGFAEARANLPRYPSASD
ncbi:MAG: hypothetical protein N2C14_20095 [Planctomycetales bacterium]